MAYNIKTVNGFQTEDGTTFTTYDAAISHARELLHDDIGDYLQTALADEMQMIVQEAFGFVVDAVLDGVVLNWKAPQPQPTPEPDPAPPIEEEE